MRIDAFGGGQTLGAVRQAARQAERTGFDGFWIPEGGAPTSRWPPRPPRRPTA